MKNTSRFLMMCVAALAVIALSAVTTIPVLADDGDAPPPEAPAQTETPPEAVGDSEPAQEANPIDTEPALEETPIEGEPAQEESPIKTEPAQEVPAPEETETPALPELLEQLPEETEVIVVDETGEALPLASEEAAQVIVTGDPMWCPVGVVPGGAGCSPSFQFFNVADDGVGAGGLLNWISNNPALVAKAGVIWVASNYDPRTGGPIESGTSITINAATDGAGTMENFALTIQGGWSGLNNTTVNLNNPSVFKLPLNISGWIGAITIKNVVFDGIASSPNYTLDVQTNGNILLDGVAVINNTGSGARLDNDDAAAGLGTIVVNNSVFSNNSGGDGLTILTDGTVTTNNIVANNNGNDGVEIDNRGAVADKTVTMKGYKQFNDNGANGLYIQARGAVLLSNLNADYNGGSGVKIDNTVSPLAGVTITGVNYFTENAGNGLEIDSRGIVTLSNLNALYNQVSGADIDNSTGVAKIVTINGVNNFSWNIASGLTVVSNGTITLYNANATYNDTGSGVFLNNASSVTGAANVSVFGTNYFLYNNQGDTDDGADAGLKVLSHGAITANNVTASFNNGSGAYLDNCDKDAMRSSVCDLPLARNITLTGVNVFNENVGVNTKGNGVEAFSFGTVTLNNVTANSNIENGALLRNNTKAQDPITLLDKFSSGGVTINVYGIFNFNGADGLNVNSQGNVLVANLTASSNGPNADGDGAYIIAKKPAGVAGTATVKLTGVNIFNNNTGTGLTIEADGVISVNSTTANENGAWNGTKRDGYGVYLDNSQTAYTTATVVITGYLRLEGNPQEGLLVESRGAVTVNNITASNNGTMCDNPVSETVCGGTWVYSDGVSIVNTAADNTPTNLATPQNVSILGTNSFVGNGKNGLYVDTYGIIVLYNATASENGVAGVGTGLYLDNYDAAYTLTLYKGVSIYGYARVINNANGGLYINTRGAVTLANLYANFNGTIDGVYIKNNYTNPLGTAAVSQNVTITGVNTFANNVGNGLYVLTYGAISVSNITAAQNGANGAYLNNCRAVDGVECPDLSGTDISVAKNLTITGINSFYRNTYNGLYFSVSGAASLARVTANYNGINGNPADDYKGVNGISTGAMTLTCLHVYGNGYNNNDGYALTTSGAMVLFNGTYYGLPTMGTVTGAAIGYPSYKVNLLCP